MAEKLDGMTDDCPKGTTTPEKGLDVQQNEVYDSETGDDATNDTATKDSETKNSETKDGETKDGETMEGETKDGETNDAATRNGETNDDERKNGESINKINAETNVKQDNDIERDDSKRNGSTENASEASSKVNTDRQQGVRIKTEEAQNVNTDPNEGSSVNIKIENCVHFDPEKVAEQSSEESAGSVGTSDTRVKTETQSEVESASKTTGLSSAADADDEEDVVEVTEITTIIKGETKAEDGDLIELSTDDEDVSTTVLDIRGTIFENNSARSPLEIAGDNESDAELCVDLLDSDDDTEEGGVWTYGKDVSIKRPPQQGTSKWFPQTRVISQMQGTEQDDKRLAKSKSRMSQGSSVPHKKVKRESDKDELGLMIASTCTADSWGEEVPLYERLAHTTKPYSNAMGIKLPSVQSRINAEIRKAHLKEIPGLKKKRLLKKAMRKDAKIKRDFHKSLENSYKERNEANSLLRSIAEEKETIVQCLSDDDEDLDEDDDDEEDDDADDDVQEEEEQVEEESDTDIVMIGDDESTQSKPEGRFCTKCKIQFFSSKSYKNHSCVSGVKALSKGLFTCTQCQKRFDSKGHLMNHLTVHEPANKYRRKFTCRFCHIVFPARSLQSKHERVFHPDLMTYSCAHCNQTFTSRSDRLSHEKEARHGAWHAIPNQDMIDLTAKFATGELNQFPHNCKVCRRSFSRGSSLMQHMASASHRDKVGWAEMQHKEKAEERQANSSDKPVAKKKRSKPRSTITMKEEVSE